MQPVGEERRLEVTVLTGLSGSGKSTAIHLLEDLGYYCIDNLPVVLIQRFLELCESSLEGLTRVALGVDIREREFFSLFPSVLDELRRAGYRVKVLFLDASDDVLVRRFSETRRPHPLRAEGGPMAAIQKERSLLVPLRERADRILDTSGLTVHQLRQQLKQFYQRPSDDDMLSVSLVSFGFKFGIPNDADMVLDVRFMANPFFVDELRGKTGCDSAVATYVLQGANALDFVSRVESFLDFVLPLHRREGRTYFTLAIGCTGGRHRSVAVAERLARKLAGEGSRVQVKHRDMHR